jgi:tripartite-type tricarboxylate transporter receptor subunit TctC
MLVGACAQSLPRIANAESPYPSKPIRFVVPYPPGGSTDVIVRTIGQHLTETWGQQLVPDHRGGAGGNIATEIAARSAPDGYTLLLGTVSTICINPSLYPKLPFDSVRDLQPVSLVVSGYYLLAVNTSIPVTNVKELVALAKAKPLNYASGGAGSAPHLAMELLKQMAQVDMNHIVYKGTAPALTDVIAGHVPVLFGSTASVLPAGKAGRVRILAITGRERSKSMPEIPTVAESGYPGFEVNAWYGVLVPARTPKDIVSRLNREIVRVTQAPDVRNRFLTLGYDPVGSTSEDFARVIQQDLARWSKVVRQARIKLD